MADLTKIPYLAVIPLGSITPLPKELLERVFERPREDAIIGKDFKTGETITIGDEERCGGLYILGKPRTGKSTLLISLALSDIKKGLDPHTDAINELLLRIS